MSCPQKHFWAWPSFVSAATGWPCFGLKWSRFCIAQFLNGMMANSLGLTLVTRLVCICIIGRYLAIIFPLCFHMHTNHNFLILFFSRPLRREPLPQSCFVGVISVVLSVAISIVLPVALMARTTSQHAQTEGGFPQIHRCSCIPNANIIVSLPNKGWHKKS